MASGFHVFLSYNRKDQETAKDIAHRLKARGLRVWLDEWAIRPGTLWQEELHRGLAESDAVAYLVGSAGLGNWQKAELLEAQDRSFSDPGPERPPLIGVLLPGASDSSGLSPFLRQFHRIDLRSGVDDSGIEKLIWGITGREPGADTDSGSPGPFGGADPQVLQGYLAWIRSTHRWLRGFVGQGERAPQVELNEAYVALRADPVGLAERMESRRWLRAAEARLRAEDPEARDERVLSDRHAYTLAYRQRSVPRRFAGSGVAPLSLGQACRTHRAFVVLGDPGSGKTTLARWLALRHATALEEGEDQIRVPAQQIDSTLHRPDEPVRLGPARLPVLVRVGELAEALRREGYRGSVVAFLGAQAAYGRPLYPSGHSRHGEEITAEDLNRLIRHFLERDRALVLFDGLDEITAEVERERVVGAIEQFVDQFVAGPPSHSPGGQAPGGGGSGLSGGNQVLVTSRIAGYHAEPLKRPLPHFLVEPLGEPAIRYFCRAWTNALRKALEPGRETEPDFDERVRRDAEALEEEIFRRPALRELAANPLLISVLASVYLTNDRRLPDHRAELYEVTVTENLMDAWRRRDANVDVQALVDLLAALAAHLHDSTSTGLLTRGALQGWLERTVADLRDDGGTSLDPEAAWTALTRESGLLTERGHGLYGFLHLTFEEYLAGRHLVRDPRSAAARMKDRLNDPRWREPLVLALGHVGLRWSPEAYAELVESLLGPAADAPLVPSGPFLLVRALGEVPEPPSPLIRRLARGLLDAAGRKRFPALSRRAEEALRTLLELRQGRFATHVEDALVAVLGEVPNPEPEPTPEADREATVAARAVQEAAARVVRAEGLFTERLGRALFTAVEQGAGGEVFRAQEDSASRDPSSPLHRLREPDDVWPEVERELDRESLAPLAEIRAVRTTGRPRAKGTAKSAGSGPPLGRVLSNEPRLLEAVVGDLEWTRLITALFGGLGNLRTPELQAELARALRQTSIGGLDPETHRRWAVHLDTELRPKAELAAGVPPALEAGRLVYPSALSDLVVEALRRGDTARELAPRLWALWRGETRPDEGASGLTQLWRSHLEETAREPPDGSRTAPSASAAETVSDASRVEALVALVALGEDVESELETLAADPSRRPLALAARDRLLQLEESLRDPVARAGHTGLLDLLRSVLDAEEALWPDATAALIELAVTSGALPVKPFELLEALEPDSRRRPQLIAEVFSSHVSGSGPDWIYNLHVMLDAVGHDVSEPRNQLIDALVAVRDARNNQWPHHLGWSRDELAPPPQDRRDALLEALTAIGGLPVEAGVFQAWLLGRLAPCLDGEHSEARPEALALAIAALRDPMDLADALGDLAPELLEMGHDERVEHVLSAARDLTSTPYLRFRALLRLLSAAPERIEELLPELLTTARREIDDPHDRVRALEGLLALAPADVERSLLDPALAAAEGLPDPAARSLALTRLATRHLSDPERRGRLSEALRTASTIEGTAARSGVLRALGTALADADEELRALWRGAVEELAPLDRARALRRLAPALEALEARGETGPSIRLDGPERIASWAAWTLLARVRDLRASLPPADEDSRVLWNRLAEGRAGALHALLDRGAVRELPFDPRVLRVLDDLEGEREEEAVDLLASLGPPDRSFLPALKRRRRRAGLADAVDLMTAEAGRPDPATLPGLIRLLQSDRDRLRLRAALVLHGRSWGIEHRSSELGRPVVEVLARRSRELGATAPRAAQVLTWTFERILFDSPEMVRAWAGDAEDGAAPGSGLPAEVARTLLGQIQRLSPDAWTAFFEELRRRRSEAQKPMLLSIVGLSVKHWSLLDHALSGSEQRELAEFLMDLARGSPDEDVRVRALEAMGYVGRGSPDAEALRDVLGIEGASARVAAAALVALGRVMARVAGPEGRIARLRSQLRQVRSHRNRGYSEKEQRRLKTLLEEVEEKWDTVDRLREVLRGHLDDDRVGVAEAAAEGLVRSGVEAPALERWIGDEGRVLEALIRATESRFAGDDYRRAVRAAGEFIVRSADRRAEGAAEGGGKGLLERVTRRLHESLGEEDAFARDTVSYRDHRMLPPVVAAAAEMMPESFTAVATGLGTDFVQRLQTAAELGQAFTTREAAVVLLGFVHDLDSSVVSALRATLHDVPDVRRAAFLAAERLRELPPESVDDLLPRLTAEDSPLAAYAVSRVLTTVAANPRLDPTLRRPVRQAVQRGLEEAVRDPRTRRHVHALERATGGFSIRHLGRLDELYHHALLELAHLDGAGGSEEAGTGDRRPRRVWVTVPADGSDGDGEVELALGDLGAETVLESQLGWRMHAGAPGTVPSEIVDSLNRFSQLARSHRVALGPLVARAAREALRRADPDAQEGP